MTLMANHWAGKGWRVTLLTYDDGSEEPAYQVDTEVIRRPLGIEGKSRNLFRAFATNLRRILVIRRAIRESDPEVVLSFLERVNVRTVLAGVGLGIPIVVSEHSDPAHHPIRRIWAALRMISYRRASGVVALTEDALAYFPEAVRRRGYVIPNPVSMDDYSLSAPSPERSKIVLAMGRLSYEKGFDQLLHAFTIVAEKHAGWTLAVWGEGPLRSVLEELRDQLGLRGRVLFPGWTADPFGEMRRAGLFVLSSRYEGFGMVLAEAMACGVAVVSFDCPSGPSEIIRHGVDGLLVPRDDVVALAGAMDRLLSDEGERKRLGARAVEVTSRFAKGSVMGMWEAVLQAAVRSQPRSRRQ